MADAPNIFNPNTVPSNMKGINLSVPGETPEVSSSAFGEPAQAPSNFASKTADETLGRVLTYGLPGIGIGAIDTIGQSLHVFGDNTVKNALNAVSPGGIGDFYSRNSTPLRVGGELATIMLPGKIGEMVLGSARFAREMGYLGDAVKNSKAVETLLGSAAGLAAREQKLSGAATDTVKNAGFIAGRTFSTPEMDAAKRAYYGARAVDAIRNSVAFEVSAYALYNTSELIFPSDYTLSDAAKWGVVGVVGGVGLDAIVGRYAARKLVQAAVAASPWSVAEKDAAEITFRPNDRGLGTTKAAIMQQQAADLAKSSGNASLATNLKQDQITWESIQAKAIKDMATDPHAFVPRTQLDDGQVQLGMAALKDNPSAFLFATKLGQLPEDTGEFYRGLWGKVEQAKEGVQSTMDKITQLSSKAAAKGVATDPTKMAKLQAQLAGHQGIITASNEIHYVIENTGDYSILSRRASNWLDEHSWDELKRTTFKENPTANTEITRLRLNIPNTNIFVLDDFSVEGRSLSLAKDFTKQVGQPGLIARNEWSPVYAAGAKIIANWRMPTIPGFKIRLSEELPRFQLEGVMNLVAKRPEAQGLVQLGGKFKTFDDVQFHILNDKFVEWNRLTDMAEKRPANVSDKLFASIKMTPEEVTAQLNLPAASGTMPQPLIQVFMHARLQKAADLYEVFANQKKGLLPQQENLMDLLRQSMKEAAGSTDPNVSFPIAGKLFQQTDTKPILVAATAAPPLAWSDEVIHNMIEQQLTRNYQRLSQVATPFVKTVVNQVAGIGAIQDAKDVQQLWDGYVSGHGIVTAQDRINDQNTALKAISMISQTTDRVINEYVSKASAAKLTPAVAFLRNSENRAHLLDFNRIENSYRYGWDIKGVEVKDGRAKFVLNNDSDINKELMKLHFDKDLNTGKGVVNYLPDMSVTARKAGQLDLNVTPDAADAAKTISDLSKQVGLEVNSLRTALGRNPIKLRDFHLPTPDLNREGAFFIKNSAGNVVGAYSADAANVNRQRAVEAAQKLMDLSKGIDTYTVVGLNDVKRERSIYDNNFFDIIDYTDQLAKTGAPIRGGLARAEIDTTSQTLEAMVKSLNENWLKVGTRARAAMFEPQLNYAKNASEAMGKSGPFGAEANIFDRYQALVYGLSPVSSTGTLQKGMRWGENTLDNMFNYLYAKKAEMISTTEAGKKGATGMFQVLRNRDVSEQELTEYNKKFGDWSPFHQAQDWMESFQPELAKATAKAFTAKASLAATTMIFRIADIGSSLLHVLGTAATLPGVLQSMRRLANETEAAHLSRTAAWGSKASNADITSFSPMRAMIRGGEAFWGNELAGPMARAAAQGQFEPEFTAMTRILTDPQAGGKSKLTEWIDKASWLSDHGESFSRALTWGIGYKMGMDLHKFEDERNAFIYANDFVNKVIGNYHPRNKPAMFQGAIGIPLGSMQTWMFNYYRNMFSFMERGDYRSLGAAYLTQASFFGAGSVPGWTAFNHYLLSNYDGSDNLSTRLDRTLPTGVSELLLHGTISQIPAIFGAGGINVYTRGGVDYSGILVHPTDFPSVYDASRAPPIQFYANVAKGIKASIDNVFSQSGWDAEAQEHILANYSGNRAVRTIMELVTNSKTDNLGNVIKYGTRDAIHLAADAVGSMTSDDTRYRDSYYAQRQVELTQEAAREQLDTKTRSMIRSGDLSVGVMQGLASDYIHSGGDPAYFGTWLRNMTVTAMVPKSEAKMRELANSGKYLEFLNMLSALQQNSTSQGVQ